MYRTAPAFLLIVATALLGACSSRRAPARAQGAAPTSIAFTAGAPAAWPAASPSSAYVAPTPAYPAPSYAPPAPPRPSASAPGVAPIPTPGPSVGPSDWSSPAPPAPGSGSACGGAGGG